MLYKLLMVMVELDIGLIQALLPPIIQSILVDHQFLIVIVMTEVEISLIPDNFLHITMMDYTLPTQGLLKKIFQGVCKDKINTKIILIILI